MQRHAGVLPEPGHSQRREPGGHGRGGHLEHSAGPQQRLAGRDYAVQRGRRGPPRRRLHSGNPGATSTILTYDPNGYALDSTGTPIAADGVARTVELVGGTRTLYNQSPGLPFISGSGTTTIDSGLGFLVQSTSSSVTLQYQTNWAGNLLIASSNGVGGTFNIKRSGGIVSVASGAQMTIQAGSTVNISNDNSSTLVMSTVPDATYGFLVPPAPPAPLPVLNNVLYDRPATRWPSPTTARST